MIPVERPDNCPVPSCRPLFVRQRLCWGRMASLKPDPNWQKYEGDPRDLLKNTHRNCLDGEEQYQVNAADCLYEAEACIAVLRDVSAHGLYNPLPDLAVPDPLGRLRRILVEGRDE